MLKQFCLILILIYFFFIIDYLWFRFLKYVRKDEYIQNINYSLNWWSEYFKNKYR